MKSTSCKISILIILLTLLSPALGAAASEPGIAAVPQGLSADDALWRECPLGDYVADAVRLASGAQAALIPSTLLKNALVGDGTVTEADVTDLFTEDRSVYVYSLSGPELKALLEDSVSHWQLNEREKLDGEASAYGGYFQISGLSVTADATAAAGDRIVSVALGDEALDLTDTAVTIRIAVPREPKDGETGARQESSLAAMTREHIVAQGTVELPESGRMHVIGAHERDIITVIPIWVFVFLLIVFASNGLLTKTRKNET